MGDAPVKDCMWMRCCDAFNACTPAESRAMASNGLARVAIMLGSRQMLPFNDYVYAKCVAQ